MEAAARSWQERWANDTSVRRISVALKLASVLLGVVVSAFQGDLQQNWGAAVLLVLLTLAAEAAWAFGLRSPGVTILECLLAGAIIALLPMSLPYLPYLLAAAAIAAFRFGTLVGLAGVGAAGLSIFSLEEVLGAGLRGSSASAVTQWLLMSVIGVGAGTWARAWEYRFLRDDDRYQAAYELLIRLRDVTRRLPMGLDDVSAGATVLDLVGREAPFERGAVLRIDEDGPPQPLAVSGGDSIPWYPVATSWLMRRVDEKDGPAQSMVWLGEADAAGDDDTGRRNFRAILPVNLSGSRIGLVTLQRATPWTDDQLAAAQRVVNQSALMLDTAFVFADIRSLATTEERMRLAREIHDGVAQEIAGLAYVVDDISHRESDPHLRTDLDGLRDELTRVVSELRLSIFELRTGLEPGTALGASISSYVRQIGARAGLTVHLVLEEDATRLATDVEVEILRIVQEAVTNARRHSQAKNLWVTVRTSPPSASIRIADDGIGISNRRSDSYGLEIMRERATRIGGQLDVRQRVGGGTVVDLSVGDRSASAPELEREIAPH